MRAHQRATAPRSLQAYLNTPKQERKITKPPSPEPEEDIEELEPEIDQTPIEIPEILKTPRIVQKSIGFTPIPDGYVDSSEDDMPAIQEGEEEEPSPADTIEKSLQSQDEGQKLDDPVLPTTELTGENSSFKDLIAKKAAETEVKLRFQPGEVVEDPESDTEIQAIPDELKLSKEPGEQIKIDWEKVRQHEAQKNAEPTEILFESKLDCYENSDFKI